MQLTVTASDNQPSARTAEAYVTVYVTRNPNGPRFERPEYQVDISEYEELNAVIETVLARDDDPDNVRN